MVPELVSAGFPLPDGGEAALVGLPVGSGGIAGATPFSMESAPHLVWWAGRRQELMAWCDMTGEESERQWPTAWTLPGRSVMFHRDGAVVGVLNVTPDSFSDGGRYVTPGLQADRVRAILHEGALLADVGAESTRPGHTPIDADAEWRRLSPLLEALGPSELGRLSIDTRHGETARRAVKSGVAAINDVSGRPDPVMREVLASDSVGYVFMFNRDEPFPPGTFGIGRMLREMDEKMASLLDGGVSRDRVAVDPGLGFAYGGDENLAVLRHLRLFRLFDRPLLVGGSRKRFVGRITGRAVGERDPAGTALAALMRLYGADLIRTHSVRDAVDALRVAEALA